jgi:hypothetical protein
MSTTTNGDLSLPHDPLTPLDPDSPPTAWTVRTLRNELYANARSIESKLGGGEHGHMGMLMTETAYIKISQGGKPYVFPEEPKVPTYEGEAATRDQLREDYKEAMATYQTARDLQTKLRKLMLQAIPEIYITNLRHPLVRFSNTHPRAILQHLMKEYGHITPEDLEANMERIRKPWNPDTPIEGVFTNGTDCREFAIEGGNPINDMAYLQILITIFRQSGVMDDSLRTWAMKTAENQTLNKAIDHFTRANRYQRANRAYLKETIAANQVIRAPAPRPPQQNTTPAQGTGQTLRGFHYCWTHGICTHEGAHCRFPTEGHIPTATLSDSQGGSLRVRIPNARGRMNNRMGGRGSGGRTQNRAAKRKADETQTGET